MRSDESTRPLDDKLVAYQAFNPVTGAISVYELPLHLVNGMTAANYIASLQDNLLGVQYYRLTDRRVIGAGTTVPKGKYQFFDKQQHSDDEKSMDGGAVIADKTADFTNMRAAGTLPGGNTMIVESLQCSVFIPHRDFNGFTVSGTALPSTAAPATTDTNSATNSLLALHYNSKLSFSEPDYGVHADGSILDFPSDRFINAAYGGATSEGIVQVGMGQPEYLRYIRVLQASHHFDVELEVFRDTTFPLSVIIDMALVGQRLF